MANRLWTVPDSFQHSPGLAMKPPPYHTKSMSFVTNSNILQKKYAVSWADFANCFKLGTAFENVCFVNAMNRNSALDTNRILTWRSFSWPRKLYAGDEIYRLQLKAVFVSPSFVKHSLLHLSSAPHFWWLRIPAEWANRLEMKTCCAPCLKQANQSCCYQERIWAAGWRLDQK